MTCKENQLGQLVKPRRVKAVPADHPDLPYIGLEHVEAQTTKLLGSVPATDMRSSANRFYAGDVLYSRLRPYLNKVWLADRDGLCSSEFIVMPGNDSVDGRFLCYRLNASDFVSFANSLNAGDRPRVDFDQISSFPIPPFSLSRQRRIVAEIEKQFSRLDEGVAALKRAQANLKRYRAAVLKAACEGRLVENEVKRKREEGRSLETGEQLLQRILAERRQKWTGRGKYKEPAAPDTSKLPKLPGGWTYCTMELLANIVDPHPSHRTPPEVPNGVPYIGIGDIRRDGTIDMLNARKVSPGVFEDHRQRYQLRDGDFIVGKIGTVGKAARVQEPFNYTLSANIVLIQPHETSTHRGYIQMLLESPELQKTFHQGSRATTQAAFGIHKFRLLQIPLPPLAEQKRIVAEVERRLSVIDELESVVTSNLLRAAHLRQAVLQKAFKGEL